MSQIINSDMTVQELFNSYGMGNEKIFFTWLYDFLDNNNIDVPEWLDGTYSILDSAYVYEHSGDKHLSRFITKIANGSDTLSVLNESYIAVIAWSKFRDKWAKEYAALTASYDPLENYNSTEKITRSGDDTVSSKVDMDATGYDKAFNTRDFEASSKSHTEADDTKNFNKTTFNSAVDTSKHGNIGVTTSQQMLDAEIELRNKWNFYNILMNDIDSLLTTNLY